MTAVILSSRCSRAFGSFDTIAVQPFLLVETDIMEVFIAANAVN